METQIKGGNKMYAKTNRLKPHPQGIIPKLRELAPDTTNLPPSTATANRRLVALIDAPNIEKAADQVGSLNYHKLYSLLQQNNSLLTAFVFLLKTEGVAGHESKEEALKQIGYFVIVKTQFIRPDGTRKGDVDVLLTLMAVETMARYDELVLCSGDGDFAPLLRFLRMRGITTGVLSFPYCTSQDLIRSADWYVPVGRDLYLPTQKEG